MPTKDQTRGHLIITVHGIRTYGAWQESLKQLVLNRKPEIQFASYKYGFFSLLAFLIPIFRWIEVRRFRRELRALVCAHPNSRVDIVAHSFGTHIVAWGLTKISYSERFRVDTIVLCGSVLRPGFRWVDLLEKKSVRRVINECGTKDLPLVLSQLFVLFTGAAGLFGFKGMETNRFRNNWYKLGHSGFFSNDFMSKRWVPLFAEEELPVRCDERSIGFSSSVLSLLSIAEPFKLLGYIGIVVLFMWTSLSLLQWQIQERANAIIANIGTTTGGSIERSEADALWRLSGSSYRVKRQVLLTLISQPGLAMRLLNRSDYIIQAEVGLNVNTRNRLARDVLTQCRATRWSSLDSTEAACLVLAEHLDQGSPETLRWMVHLTDTAHDSVALSKLAGALLSVFQKVSNKNAAALLSDVIHTIAEGTELSKMAVIGNAVVGLGRSPNLSNATSRLMFDQTLRAVVQIRREEGRAVLGPGLREMALRLGNDDARTAFAQLLNVMRNSRDITTLVSCWQALIAVSDRQNEDGKRAALAELVAVFRIIQNPQILASMGQMLAKYGKAIPKADLEDTLARQMEVLNRVSSGEHGSHNENSVYLISAIAVGLGDLSETNPSIAHLAYSKMNEVLATDLSPTSLAFSSDGIVALAGALSPEDARREFERAVAEIKRTPTAFKVVVFGNALTALGRRLTVVDARGLSPILLADLEQMDREGSRRGDSDYSTAVWTLSQGLRAVAEKIGTSDPDEAFRILLRALGKTKSGIALTGLSGGLKVVAGHLSQTDLRRICKELLDQMGATENQSDWLANKPELEALMTSFNQSESQRAFEILLRWRERMGPTFLLGDLAQVGVRAGEVNVRVVFDQLMTIFPSIKSDVELKIWADQMIVVGQGLAGQTSKELYLELELLRRVPSPPCSILGPLIDNSKVPQILEVLKWPTCSPTDRDSLIERVGKLEGQTFGQHSAEKFRPDVWSLVAWAQEHGLNVNSPPRNSPAGL